MKYLIYLLVIISLFSCQKEDELKNEIDFSNVYAIVDNPNDPVQHERYLLFKEFDVSVYFNDTIAQKFIRNDINGNPVYHYETIDPNWVFYNDNEQQIDGTFHFFYTEEQEKQLNSLKHIRTFLSGLVPEMRPSIIMSADSVYVVNSTGTVNMTFGSAMNTESLYRSNFRMILITTLADCDDAQGANIFLDIKRDLISSKIYNYTEEIQEFQEVVKDNYGDGGVFKFPEWDPYNNQTFRTYYGNPLCMFNFTFESYLEYLNSIRLENVTDKEAYAVESWEKYASIVGPWGFVSPRTTTGTGKDATPSTVEQDVNSYLTIMLKLSEEEFSKYWGKYPLVMKKYDILYKTIRDKMGIEIYN